ncbi:MAG: TonB-dependent receptor, partial [Blastocatellia bacterium]
MKNTVLITVLSACCLFCLAAIGFGQTTGTIRGTVKLESQDVEVHDVIVVITQLKRSTTTDEKGAFEFKDVPPGVYSIVAKFDRLPDVLEKVEVKAGEIATLDLKLKLTGVRDQVTVSATGNEQSTLESFQSVNSLEATTLLERDTSSLGEALDHQTGIAKRSSGPGASRPVIRGFDGDRVLVAQDGIRSGSLSSTSGDHGEPINVLSVEKIEVVRGPATLLYGSNAIGGLVNAVSGHEQQHAGLHGYFSGIGASTQNLGGVSAGLEFGKGKWLVWGNGGGQKSGDYSSALGKVLNTGLRNYDFTGGSGYFTDKGFFNASYGYNSNFYGVPYDTTEANPEISKLDMHRHDLRLNVGLNNVASSLEHVHLTFDYTDYKHQELVDGTPATSFFNKTYSYRSFFEQKKAGKLSGSFGVSGFYRDFKTVGDEVLAPPTTQNTFAAFAVETVDFKRVALQFGGRIEHNGYSPISSSGLPDRSFTGFSGAFGVRVPVWEHGVFAANYVHSYRAPSLDELYNNGPHPGNLTFEIGNPNLKRERGDGIDLSLRHSSERLRAEGHYFNYKFGDFVFLAPTGARQSGLPVARYSQA